jgi:hypothetical protein
MRVEFVLTLYVLSNCIGFALLVALARAREEVARLRESILQGSVRVDARTRRSGRWGGR